MAQKQITRRPLDREIIKTYIYFFHFEKVLKITFCEEQKNLD